MEFETIRLTQQALWIMLILSAPFIIGSTLTGLLISFLQAVTQLQEQTLSFAVKLAVTAVLILLFSGLIGETLAQFATSIFSALPLMVHP